MISLFNVVNIFTGWNRISGIEDGLISDQEGRTVRRAEEEYRTLYSERCLAHGTMLK